MAERIEDENDVGNLDPLEVKVEAGLDGTLREVILVMCTGGPHIEVSSNGYVYGTWGGNTHTTHYTNDRIESDIWDLYGHYWEMAETSY